MVNRILSALVTISIILGLTLPGSTFAQSTDCQLVTSNVPLGQVNPSTSGDPLVPTWCLTATPHLPTRVTGVNDWVDSFDIGPGNIARFDDGDMDYRVFDNVAGSGARTKHLIVSDHWLDDNAAPFGAMAFIRPNRTFTFEHGMLVVEGDFSAGKGVYGAENWGEFVISTAPRPDVNPPDAPEQAYGYGRFKGFPTFGCRLQPARTPVCAGFLGSLVQFPNNGLSFTPSDDHAPCYSLVPDRLWELSYFQDCGNNFVGGVHFGGEPSNAAFRNPVPWRTCSSTQDYDTCLDRFRLELTQHSMTWYVNGIRYFQDSGWDANHSLPDSLINGNVYVYFSDVGNRQPTITRFHWERLAVNPHDANGNLLPPSASPSFGLVPPTVVPTVTPTITPTATLTNTPTPTPTNTSTPTPTPINTPVTTCEVSVRLNGVQGPWLKCN